MNVRRLVILQWLAFLGGGTLWFVEFLAGAATTAAVCNPGSGRWDIPHDAVQTALAAFAVTAIVLAQVAAVVVFRATRDLEDQDAPPHGRLHFFAAASLLANTIFLVIVVLTAIATLVNRTCQQA